MSHRSFRGGSERGLTMIELMVSLVVFAIAATAIVAGLIATMSSTTSSRNRLQASSLAAREMEIVRNEFVATKTGPADLGVANQVTNPHPLPGGIAGSPLNVDGSPYTVVRNVEWLAAGTGKSACDGGAALTYPSLAVSVSVTWPRMGSVKPVVANTVLTPPKGILASDLSFVAVRVAGVTNLPMPGQAVKLTGPGGPYSDTTAADGCAVFPLSSAGTYIASLDTSGVYVDPVGNTNPSQTFTVALSKLVQGSFSYDLAATLAVTLYTDPSPFSLPTGGVVIGLPKPRISLYNIGIPPLGAMSVVSSPTLTALGTTVTSIGRLWPYTTGYAIWAGSCKQSDPVAAGGTGVVVPTPPGATPALSIRLAPVTITATSLLGIPIGSATVTATPVTATNCVAPDTGLTLGVTNSVGVLTTSLPVGKWILKVGNMNPTTTTGTLLQNSAPSSYAMSVS
jgi:prepilin-type N-terminal cleavage/methylation domain-containing protein